MLRRTDINTQTGVDFLPVARPLSNHAAFEASHSPATDSWSSSISDADTVLDLIDDLGRNSPRFMRAQSFDSLASTGMDSDDARTHYPSAASPAMSYSSSSISADSESSSIFNSPAFDARSAMAQNQEQLFDFRNVFDPSQPSSFQSSPMGMSSSAASAAWTPCTSQLSAYQSAASSSSRVPTPSLYAHHSESSSSSPATCGFPISPNYYSCLLA